MCSSIDIHHLDYFIVRILKSRVRAGEILLTRGNVSGGQLFVAGKKILFVDKKIENGARCTFDCVIWLFCLISRHGCRYVLNFFFDGYNINSSYNFTIYLFLLLWSYLLISYLKFI